MSNIEEASFVGGEKGGEIFIFGGGGVALFKGGGELSVGGGRGGDIPVPECFACFACLLITVLLKSSMKQGVILEKFFPT